MELAKEHAKNVLVSLTEKYREVLGREKESDLLEEDVKIKFMNPLLKGLGWDIEGLDEVKFEQRTPRGRADFALRTDVNSPPEILFEVKAFRENLDGHRIVAGKKQSYPKKAIDDAWSLKVDFCVLTNFKELRLYYTKVRKPEDGLIFKIKLEDYLAEDGFERLWSLSKESIKTGALLRHEKRRTREDVSTEIVKELFAMRKTLLNSIREKNELSPVALKESVQRILDRLVVIRVAEDRDVIHPESLSDMIATWKRTAINKSVRTLIKELKNLFRDFDDVYNSSLFREHFCEDLYIDNTIIEDVINTLYSYNFELIDADVLGSIYEDYLGHVLREETLDIVEDYSVRKESGVYYTHPTIVEYIIENTLGRILSEISDPSCIQKIRVVDPACGSGSFLIKAFDFIKKWYDEHNKRILQVARHDGSLDSFINNSLVNNFRHKIIVENLFGVDLDPQATEIASMNLVLKALRKGEKLPEILGENVKCGNSLVWDSQEDMNAFVWEGEFEEVMKNDGFDVCVGNPPWGADLSKSKDYLEKNYELAQGQYDSYELFIELSRKILKEGGIWGFVIPDSIFKPEHENLRKFLCLENQIEAIVKLGEGFFRGVFRSGVIVIFRKKNPQKDHLVSALTLLKEDRKRLMKGKTTISKIEIERRILIPQERFMKDEHFTFDIAKSVEDEEIMQKMESRKMNWNEIIDSSRGVEFSESGMVIQCPNCFKWNNPPRKRKRKYIQKKCAHCGIEYSIDEAFKKEVIVSKEKARESDSPFITGKSVNRYHVAAVEYLDTTKEGIGYKESSLYKPPKILVRKTGVGIYATIDYIGAYCPQAVFILRLREDIPQSYDGLELEYILGVLNSRAILYYYYKKFGELEWKSFPYVTQKTLGQLPIPDIDFSDPEKKNMHDEIVKKVSNLLHKRGDFEKLDFEVEDLVMKLYGITPEMKVHMWNELKKVQKLRIIREVME